MTQRDQVRKILEAGPACGTVFLNAYIPRAAARIHELRQQGLEIHSERCKLHQHKNAQTLYTLAGHYGPTSEPEFSL